MTLKPPTTLPRRAWLKAALAGTASLGAASLLRPAVAQERAPKFLIVIGANGGASIIDSFLAIRHSECNNADTINCFPDEQVSSFAGSPLRAVDLSLPTTGPLPFPLEARQSEFVRKYQNEMLVVPLRHSSVNHLVGQQRAITGNSAWRGRTLQECVALEYGQSAPMPNINMSALGFAERGRDPSLPPRYVAEPVTQPRSWPLGLHGSRGVRGAPAPTLVDAARRMRNAALEEPSAFQRTFGGSVALSRWREQRQFATEFESQELIERLMLMADDPEQTPLSAFGLRGAPDDERIRRALPNLEADPMEAQAALSFALLKSRVAFTTTIWPSDRLLIAGGTSLLNPPLAFDFSHSIHRPTQAAVWSRVLRVLDGLITLLRGEPLDATSGESLWDHTLIYVATEFGRSKNRLGRSETFGSGHDLNNGVLLISPLLRGNRVLGGVDPHTGLTFGVDPVTGVPEPGRENTEGQLFASILYTLDVNTTGSGLPSPLPFRG
jgi:hypothetical protein